MMFPAKSVKFVVRQGPHPFVERNEKKPSLGEETAPSHGLRRDSSPEMEPLA